MKNIEVGLGFMSIKIKNFKKSYRNQDVVLEDMELEQRVTILYGENGSGKSTILKAVAGLIRYEGIIESDLEIAYLCERDSVVKEITVLEYMNFFLAMEDYKKEEMVILLHLLSLEDTLNKYVHELSKGMLKKVYLFLTLILKRDCYLLDEPFGGMDKESISRMKKYIETSNKRFVISTHNKEVIEGLKGKVLTL